ncbi:GAF domain-containing protein [Mastigocoleus sp. MO_188.B34]|uniref:GAF domain-containing protein n=1 Tax=Mastigocoleus sp. MO_188.B34 TaxID=3036635 RepID=UPI002624DFC0|nr:GAF domain-containing protein [Mastigocoleus sp. MO_188.B34]MDJ0697971.1 GAF domain-containing protein [Mastigocoleus sp. MO_188.B34]
MLNTINLLTNHSFDLKLQTTLQVISLKIAQLLQAKQVTFFIVDRKHQILWSKNARGKDGELINIEIPIDTGIAGHVATTGETLNIPDPYNDARFNPKIDRDSGFRSRSILCLPIINSQGEVFAVVEALNKQGNIPFDKRDEERFYELTQSLEFAVQSSILYAQSRMALSKATSFAE